MQVHWTYIEPSLAHDEDSVNSCEACGGHMCIRLPQNHLWRSWKGIFQFWLKTGSAFSGPLEASDSSRHDQSKASVTFRALMCSKKYGFCYLQFSVSLI